MSHPFTSHRRSIVIYVLVWVFAAFLYVSMLFFNRNFELAISITEGVLVTFLFGLLGLIAWYPIRYIPFRKETPIYSASAHLVAGLIVIIVWLFSSVGVLDVIFSSDEAYQSFLTNTIGMRAFIGLMIYLVLVLVYYLISYARRLRERAQAEEKLRTLVKESELNLLKSQINPHFLFNSLNSISSLIISNPDEAQTMIIKLSDFLRYSLKHRENEFVSLEEEIGRMKDYLSIEQVRFGDKLTYCLNTSEKCKRIQVPTMILQPIIENAIKHGVYESLEPVEVQFTCEIDGDFLHLQLLNDFDPDQPSKKGTGVGLQNVSERIRLGYDGKGRVNWSKDKGKFRVSLYLPL